MTTMSIPRCGQFERRKTSRINRLALFLLTASPSFREATIPSLLAPASFGATRIVRYRPLDRSDRSKTLWNSPRRLTRRSFEKRSDGMAALRRRKNARRRYEEETVRRLRPFARRRFSTCRPFFVAMRTRNPCVRLRRRRFGWNVTLIVGIPCNERRKAEKPR